MPGIQEQVNNNIANLPQGGYMQTQNGTFGNGYLSTGELDPNQGKGGWEDYVRQLGFSNLENITDFNSPLYQQYAQYLQKTMPGIGANTLLAPLMAGGVGYAGGQAIVNQKVSALSKKRSDMINQGVQGFSLGNIGTGASLLGQQGQLGLGYAGLSEQRRQYDDQNTWYNQIGNFLGQGAALLPGLLGGGGSSLSGVNGAGQSGGQFNGNVKVVGYGNQQDLNYFDKKPWE